MPEVPEVPWGHRVGLMSLLMIHKAYMPVYSDPYFSCGTDEPTEGSTRGPRGPKKKRSKFCRRKNIEEEEKTFAEISAPTFEAFTPLRPSYLFRSSPC